MRYANSQFEGADDDITAVSLNLLATLGGRPEFQLRHGFPEAYRGEHEKPVPRSAAPLLIDHIIYAHPDLDVAVAEIEDRFGVRAAGGGQHPGRGTHNKVLGLGPRTYLEVIAPDPTQPEPSESRPYGVEGITRGQLVGWALACEDIERAVERARSKGFDPAGVVDGQRVSPTGALLRWRVTGNAQAAGLVPFLIEWGQTPHPAVDATPGLALLSVHLEHPDPRSLATALKALGANVEVREASEPALVARIGGPHGEQELR